MNSVKLAIDARSWFGETETSFLGAVRLWQVIPTLMRFAQIHAPLCTFAHEPIQAS